MAIGRAYRIKKSEVKGYGYTKPNGRARSKGPRYAANPGVTSIAAINGRGAYSARKRMSGLSKNRRRSVAKSSLSAAKKRAFARSMKSSRARSHRPNASSPIRKNPLRVKRASFSRNGKTYNQYDRYVSKGQTPAQRRESEASIARYRESVGLKPLKRRAAKKTRRRVRPARRGSTSKSVIARRKKPMARKVRRRKKSAARSRVKAAPKRRVRRRRKTAKRASAAPKRRRRRKVAKKTAAPKRRRRRVAKKASAPKRRRRRSSKKKLKANGRRRRRSMRRNYGTRRGAKRGWRTRKARYTATSYRKRSRRRKKASAAPRRRRRKASAAPKRRRRRSRRMAANSRRRHRRNRSHHRRSRRRRSMKANRHHRRSHKRNRRHSRRMRRNGRRMFQKNGIGDTLGFIAKTGSLALGGFVAHKLFTNLLVKYAFSAIFSTPATVTPAPATPATPAAAVVTPATSGLSGISLDATYQKLIASALVGGLGVFATAKLVKDPGARNTVMTGFALSFTHSLLTFGLSKFAPQYSDMLSGDGTAARLSAMYGFGNATSIQPRYQAIGEYFTGTNGLGEYFSSGVSGLGALPAYEAAAGYGQNPDLYEAAAGYGAMGATNTDHIDPTSDLDRELTIAEAAAGVGALPSYEAAAGMRGMGEYFSSGVSGLGSISTVPSTSTWIPGTSNGQLWAGVKSISNPQSASEMVPAGVLQTEGGQGVFG